MSVLTYYPYIKLAIILIGSTGKCIGVKKAAGETIDLWDWLECAVQSLSSIEDDLIPLLAKADQANVRSKL